METLWFSYEIVYSSFCKSNDFDLLCISIGMGICFLDSETIDFLEIFKILSIFQRLTRNEEWNHLFLNSYFLLDRRVVYHGKNKKKQGDGALIISETLLSDPVLTNGNKKLNVLLFHPLQSLEIICAAAINVGGGDINLVSDLIRYDCYFDSQNFCTSHVDYFGQCYTHAIGYESSLYFMLCTKTASRVTFGETHAMVTFSFILTSQFKEDELNQIRAYFYSIEEETKKLTRRSRYSLKKLISSIDYNFFLEVMEEKGKLTFSCKDWSYLLLAVDVTLPQSY
ncbi:hypothetical protein DICVIV_09851 [Dictyocaulus viviparus]|uniref:Uncharacterized protein n=1 Tax=Dictyocaulus viviparus TaxID=29172 RepID=A0A0D8XHN2_DICVI|nr:hypothetical protein DICVIV_09851 [Dictyocaulus viviparus]